MYSVSILNSRFPILTSIRNRVVLSFLIVIGVTMNMPVLFNDVLKI